MGILLAIGGMSFRSPSERTAANAVQSFVQQGRFEAIKTNRPVLVSYDGSDQRLSLARMADSTTVACASAGKPTRQLSLTDFGAVRVSEDAFSLVWLPNGQPRACPSGVAPLDAKRGVAMTLSGSKSSYVVGVSAGGEVSVK